MMTDEELDSFEDACKVVYDGMYGYGSQQYLELIAMIRQARAERDWLAEKLEENAVCCLPENEECGCSFCSDCGYCTYEGWLNAVKEATCRK